MFRIIGILISCFLLLVLNAKSDFAQINISDNDILALKGSSRTALAADSIQILVEIGEGGMNNTWDYSGIDPSLYFEGSLEYMDPINGYEKDRFPEANFLQRLSAETEQGPFLMDTYMRITSDQFRTYGTASSFFGFSLLEFSDNDISPLPMTYGTSWIAVSNDTSESIGFLTVAIDTTLNVVDSYGTLKLPSGDFECLRLRQASKTISSTTFNGFPIGLTDTTESVTYTWLSKTHLLTLTVDSTDNGMGEVSMVVSGEATSVGSSEDTYLVFELAQNYPNPFNPTTMITYSIPKSGQMQLTVFDILGNEVAVLEKGYKSEGQYSKIFNGNNLSSGIYFYTLKLDNFIETKKMLLLK